MALGSNVRAMRDSLVADEVVDSDAELVRQLALGRQEALGPLYARYAPLVFGVAAHSLDRAAAEEIVQDVFLAIWRKAADFDPQQGAFRAWLLQLAHWRVLNELRRRSRRPQLEPDDGGLDSLPDLLQADPAERVSHAERRAAIRSAMDALPAAQRQAVALAFFDELTHAQVARRLGLPLGTAKTRIRSGLHGLRLHLAPLAATLVLAGGVLAAGLKAWQTQIALERDERALGLASASDVERRHLSPALAGLPADAHGSYQTRPGATLAILTVTDLPAAPAGQRYVAWLEQGTTWTALGELTPDAHGGGRLIAEAQTLGAAPPTLVEVTLESGGGPNPKEPSGPVVLAWAPS
jgi:RNA polymerase sigma-70 factor (ECF subfamily)